MLYTNLNHIESAGEYAKILSENDNVVIICGRMGPLCVPVYLITEELEKQYPQVRFFDMEYDNPSSYFFHAMPEVRDLAEIPFVVYYRKGEVVMATAGLQSKKQITAILDNTFVV